MEAWLKVTQILANIVITVGLITTGFAFLQNHWSEQRATTSRYIEALHSAELSSAQLVLFQLWSDQNLIAFENFALPRKTIDTLVEKAIARNPETRNSVRASIFTMTSYFDRLESCAQLRRCERSEIDQQIGSYGRNFYCTYQGEIMKLRSQLLFKSLGARLAEFAERMGGCELSSENQ